MDLGEDVDFAFKHPYFFEKFTFKFQGLQQEIKDEYESIAKSMGATISEDAKIVFTDILNKPVNSSQTYYSLNYLCDSIIAEKPLDVKNYKLCNVSQVSTQSKFCCYNAKYIWRNHSCSNYVSQYIECNRCKKKESSRTNEPMENVNNGQSNSPVAQSSIDLNQPSTSKLTSNGNNAEVKSGINRWKRIKRVTTDSDDSNASSKSEDVRKTKKKKNTQSPKPSLIASDEKSSSDETQFVETHRNKSISPIQPKFNGNGQVNEDSCPTEPNTNGNGQVNGDNGSDSDLEIIEVYSRVDLTPKKNPAQVKSGIDKWKRKKVVTSDDSDASNESADVKKRNKNTKRPRLSPTASGDQSLSDETRHVENYHPKVASSTRTKSKGHVQVNKDNYSDSDFEVQSDDLNKPSTSKQKHKKDQRKVKSSVTKWKNTKKVTTSDSDGSNWSVDMKKRKGKSKRPITPADSEESSLHEPRIGGTWWVELPPPTNPDPDYQEPDSKTRGRVRRRDYTLEEKRIIIAYLIVNNKIDEGTSRLPWRQMHQDGYLQDRTIESISNAYRRVLLPKIESFRLPKDIENKFIADRNTHKIPRKSD